MTRSHEIAVESGLLSPNGYWFRWVQISLTEWALELNPEEAGKLTQEEQTKLMAIKSIPIQAQSFGEGGHRVGDSVIHFGRRRLCDHLYPGGG